VTPKEIANLEHASRSALAWIPDVADERRKMSSLIAAAVPAVGIIAASAALLLVVLQ
jgi:hypothetical protein